MKHKTLPMNLQLFGPGPAPAAGANPPAPPAAEGGDNPPENNTGQANPGQTLQVDYDKIQQMLEGTLKAKEEVALKNYFKQQGLTQEEADKAIQDFKAQKAKNAPDVSGLQGDLEKEKAAVVQARIENAAIMAGMSMGLDAKTIPYVLKLADLSGVVDKDGKINEESVKAAISKVLEDLPQIKPAAEGNNGFQIGADSGSSGQTQTRQNQTQNQVPTKRWNRFN